MEQVGKKKLCKWHNLNENKIKRYRNLKVENYEEKIFYNNLYKIGYSKMVGTKNKDNKAIKKKIIEYFNN